VSVGLRVNRLHINGTELVLSAVLREAPKHLQSVEETFNGGRRLDAKWQGDGLPDRPIRYDFSLGWDLGSPDETTVEFLEELRVTPGPHSFTFWKAIVNLWTAASGQVVFYLPRPDAYTYSIAGHTAAEWKAVVAVDGVAITEANTLYPGAVTAATSVDAGKVAFSTSTVEHPDSDQTVTLFKFGTAPGADAIVTVWYFPMYQVDVASLETTPFTGENVGREDKTLELIEVA
jgi:hypothetical protein